MQKITPCLWFDNQGEEAAKFYVSVFKNSKITGITRYGDVGPGPKGTVMTVTFKLAGQEFIGLNGGPIFKFTEAVSLSVDCKTQKEVDYFWEKLSAGGEKSQCGWVKDKYGLSWQIVPTALVEMLKSKHTAKTQAMFAAMMQMAKLDIAALKSAFDGAGKPGKAKRKTKAKR